MNKKIKIQTVDFWMPNGYIPFILDSPSFAPYENYLSENYELCFSDEPDFLFYSCFGTEFLRYSNCIKIFFTTENIRPDFNLCDYAIGFDRMNFGERYIRLNNVVQKPQISPKIDYTKRKFCNFIAANSLDGKGAKERIEFCKLLSKYKKVDCPGRCLNNMTANIPNRSSEDWYSGKIDFLSQYKFTLAWENSYYPGYVTEKITQPFEALSIPIYMGDPDIYLDFNTKSFINCNDFNNWNEIIEYIEYLDNNEDAYMEMLTAQVYSENYVQSDIGNFLDNIIENGKIYDKFTYGGKRYNPFNRQNLIIRNIWNNCIKYAIKNENRDEIFNSIIYINDLKASNINHFLLDPIFDNIKSSLHLPIILENYFKTYSKYDIKNYLHLLNMLKAIAYRESSGDHPNLKVHLSQDEKLEGLAKKLISLLWPHESKNLSKIRFGAANYGGIVMIEPCSDSVAISVSDGYNILWELEAAKRGIKVYYFTQNAPKPHNFSRNLQVEIRNIISDNQLSPEFNFHQIISNFKNEKNLILKINLNTFGWDLISSLDATILSQFDQIIIELNCYRNHQAFESYISIITSLLSTHFPLHLHYNNRGLVTCYRNFLFCNQIEMTFKRKENLDTFLSKSALPNTDFDKQSFSEVPELYIGTLNDIIS